MTDLSGNKYGRLTVIERVENSYRKNGKPRARYKCLCECGRTKIVYAENLTSGKTSSCGCLQRERASASRKKHGMTKSKLYGVWCSMKSRCLNSASKEYPLYGGRGISVCDDWKNSYMSFYSWAIKSGYKDAPRGECTLDRIDVDGNYEPLNCRWVTQAEQMQNTRSNHYIEYNGEIHSAADWERITGIKSSKIINRISRLGWSPSRALTTL